MTKGLKIILLECKITNKLVPFNCVSLSLRTLFIMKETKVLNNKTQDQLHISALNIYSGWSVGVGNTQYENNGHKNNDDTMTANRWFHAACDLLITSLFLGRVMKQSLGISWDTREVLKLLKLINRSRKRQNNRTQTLNVQNKKQVNELLQQWKSVRDCLECKVVSIHANKIHNWDVRWSTCSI